jgi:hypothetical protein
MAAVMKPAAMIHKLALLTRMNNTSICTCIWKLVITMTTTMTIMENKVSIFI